METAISQLIKELKGQPWTMVVIIALSVYSVYSYAHHALDDDVEAKFQNIKKEVGFIEKKIDRVLEIQLAETIRTLAIRRCSETESAHDVAEIDRIIDDYNLQYYELTGRRYPVPECD